MYDIFRGLLGVTVLLGILFLCSRNRSAINWQLVGIGIGLQIALGLLVLKVPGVKDAFDFVASFFIYIIEWSEAGATFMFGKIAGKGAEDYIFAWRVLPTIMLYSVLSAILFYFGVLQKIVYGIAWVLSKAMGLSGPEALSAAGNVFIGQTEAPLIVRPYLATMSRSEVMTLMCGGMATIAGGVFAAYIGFLGGTTDEGKLLIARHLLAASLMSAPAAIVCAKILVPETETKDPAYLEKIETKPGDNLLDAIANGTSDGVKLAVNVAAMLIIFTALVYALNWILTHSLGSWAGFTFPEWTGISDISWKPLNTRVSEWTAGRADAFSFTYLLGVVFAPLAWVLGVPNQDITLIGELLGQKTIVNEFIAYLSMGNMEKAGIVFQEKSRIIALYALCGFSNFASIGIQIGGISSLAPNQRPNLTQLGFLALIGGSVACFLTAAIAGAIL